jgi:OOP family OmpA-OmpF porin
MKSFNTTEITDYLVEKQNPPEDWVSAIRAGIGTLGQLNSGQLSITDMTINLTGESSSRYSQEDINKILTSSLPNGYQKKLKITIKQNKDLASSSNQSVDTSNTSTDQSKIAECHNRLNEIISGLNITFKTGSTKITTSSTKLLDKLAKTKNECTTQLLDINGYTDSIGDSQFNLILSKKRAISVRNYLIQKGVSKQRINAKGFGEALPIANNNTIAGQKENRRIEIIVRDPKQ